MEFVEEFVEFVANTEILIKDDPNYLNLSLPRIFEYFVFLGDNFDGIDPKSLAILTGAALRVSKAIKSLFGQNKDQVRDVIRAFCEKAIKLASQPYATLITLRAENALMNIAN